MASTAPELTDLQNQNQKPTRVRYWVIVFAVTLAIITYIDRVALSQAAPTITKELNLTKEQMGYCFSAFLIFYALLEIPSGVMGDRYGPRTVLMRIVVWWSFFIAASGRAWNGISLMVIETLFGAGEAGAFPNIAKAFSVWLPRDERVRAQGIVWLSARWGGAITPYLVYQLFQYVSWRNAFGLFGLMGLVWAFFFYRWFRDKPADNPKVNAAELTLLRSAEHNAEVHGGIPWGTFGRSPQVWLLCAQYFCLSYSWYFYVTWLPTYLKEGRHLEPSRIALLAGLPLFFGGIGSILTGFISKPLAKVLGSVTKTRKALAIVGFLGASSLLILSTQLRDPTWAVIAMALASFCNDLSMPGSWGACMDVGGRYAGTLSGAMNMLGNGGGALAASLAPKILHATNNDWNFVIFVAAGVYFAGAFFWIGLDPVTPIERSTIAHVPAAG